MSCSVWQGAWPSKMIEKVGGIIKLDEEQGSGCVWRREAPSSIIETHFVCGTLADPAQAFIH